MDVEKELRFWFKEMGIYKEIKNSTLRRNNESHSWRQTLRVSMVVWIQACIYESSRKSKWQAPGIPRKSTED